ncbi:MAG TPA: hypothetical protein VG244_14890 [Acidimicrobiales bacterium]|nr:hypothetical protein [Acidimicrobiales bacterium]
MAAGVQVVRALDPVERYFWLLSQIGSVNAVLSIYADRTFEEGELRGALRTLQRRHPLSRVRVEVVDGEPVFVPTGGEIPLSIEPLGPGEPVPVARLQVRPFPDAPHPLAELIYMPVEGEDRSVLVVLAHHVFVDGNAARFMLKQLVQVLEHGDAVLGASDEVPPPLHTRFPESLRAPRAAVEVLGAMRDERAGQPAPSDFPFHERGAGALWPRHSILTLHGDALAALLGRAKATGSTVTGAIDAAVLQAAAALFADDAPRWLCLASATDLRPRVEPPLALEDAQVAIGMLCTPYLVSEATTDTLGRTIGEQIQREVARGESHLFYRFARAGTYPPTEAGFASFAKWVDSTPQNITVSSLGIIDDAGDPPWVRRLTTIMPAGSNQVSFITSATYRGELALNVSTDSAKLPADLSDRFVAEIEARTGARLEQTTSYRPA